MLPEVLVMKMPSPARGTKGEQIQSRFNKLVFRAVPRTRARR